MWLGGTLKKSSNIKNTRKISSSLNVMVDYLCVYIKLAGVGLNIGSGTGGGGGGGGAVGA